MAIRKALVIVAGQVQQLQPGDQIEAAFADLDIRSMTNGESSAAIVCGTPCYISANSAVKRAKADAASTAKCFGLAVDVTTAAGGTLNVGTNGVLTLTTAQWDAVTGGSGGLVANTDYYVSAASVGLLTNTAPSTTSQLVVYVGTALNTTDMEINPMLPILL